MIRQPVRRRLLAACIAVLAAGLPLTLSLVDAGEEMTATRVESHHDSGQCFYRHDHTACVQFLRLAGQPAASGPTCPPGARFGAAQPHPRRTAPAPS
ncbi:MAG: hypothetical protein ACE5HQ_10040, partial [Gemmatimonadota bacterium]